MTEDDFYGFYDGRTDFYGFYDGRTDFYGFYDGRTDYYDRRMDSASLHVLRQPLCAPLMLFACGTSVYRSSGIISEAMLFSTGPPDEL